MSTLKIILLSALFLTTTFLIAQNKVGIGTSSPEMKLHIQESDSTVLMLQNSNTLANKVSTGMYFKTGSGLLPYTGALKTIGHSDSKARLGLFTSTSSSTSGLIERFSITDEGFVGVGTIIPERKLHVRDFRPELLLLDNSSSLDDGTESALIFKTGSATRSFTGAIKTIGESTSEARMGLFTSAAVSSNGLQERLSIKDGGDIGIENTEPEARLHISKQDSTVLMLHNTGALAKNISNAMFFKTGNGFRSYTGAIKTIGQSSVDARLGFFTFTSPTKDDLKERMSILDNGDVGIGTVEPETKFHLSDNDSKLLTLQNTTPLNNSVENALYFKTGTENLPFTGAIKTIGENVSAARLGLFTYASAQPDNLIERLTILDNGSVGIGTTSPSATLHLDGGMILEDGSQGEGKILTSDANGRTTWMTHSPPTCNLSIGDTHEGGIIFYLDGSGCHGLVAKSTDESSVMKWTIGATSTDAVGVGLYEGEHNTNKVISKVGAGNAPALEACANLTTNGKTDWYLPSRIELDMMFVNLKLQGLGNFSNAFYWSSSEANALTAWTQDFTNGTQDGVLPFNKNATSNRVRAIRAF